MLSPDTYLHDLPSPVPPFQGPLGLHYYRSSGPVHPSAFQHLMTPEGWASATQGVSEDSRAKVGGTPAEKMLRPPAGLQVSQHALLVHLAWLHLVSGTACWPIAASRQFDWTSRI